MSKYVLNKSLTNGKRLTDSSAVYKWKNYKFN